MGSIEVGTIIAGKYRVERRLSQGGMGSLWVARQLQLQRLVAVKLMEPTLAASAEGRTRFEREARAVALIQSPHVVQIHDYGVEHDTPYIVMELLDGEDFGKRLKRERVLSLPAVARIFGQIAKALRKAHEAGMIHLDLKPANIFLARDDEEDIVKVLDFGIAKIIDTGNATETTATGVVLGSVHYMSPEQVRGRRGLDHRSDLWSLGVIAFRAVTGELPFGGTQIGDVLVKVCADPIPRASSILPTLGPDIDAFFSKALDRDPNARFQSAKELAAALAQLAWPNDPRPPMPSMTLEQAFDERPPAPRPPPTAAPPAAPPFPRFTPEAAPAELQRALPISTTAWPAPVETGTLTGSPRVSDLQVTLPRVPGPQRAWRWAILGTFAVVGLVAVTLLGSAAVSTRSPKATANAAAITAPPPSDEPAASALPAPPAANAPAPAPTPEITPPPSDSARSATTAAPSTSAAHAPREKPASPPIVSTAARPKDTPPPATAPAAKKANPALGF